MVAAQDLGSCAERRGGSSPVIRTIMFTEFIPEEAEFGMKGGEVNPDDAVL